MTLFRVFCNRCPSRFHRGGAQIIGARWRRCGAPARTATESNDPAGAGLEGEHGNSRGSKWRRSSKLFRGRRCPFGSIGPADERASAGSGGDRCLGLLLGCRVIEAATICAQCTGAYQRPGKGHRGGRARFCFHHVLARDSLPPSAGPVSDAFASRPTARMVDGYVLSIGRGYRYRTRRARVRDRRASGTTACADRAFFGLEVKRIISGLLDDRRKGLRHASGREAVAELGGPDGRRAEPRVAFLARIITGNPGRRFRAFPSIDKGSTR